MKPVALLDRDGTIIVDKNYLKDPEGVELLPGAVNGLKMLQHNGFELIILTNQSGIGRGFYTENEMYAVNRQLCRLLTEAGIKISPRRIYYCPHKPEDSCSCRKPSTGLATQAQADWLFDLDRGCVIGDKPTDIELGLKLKLPTVLVLTGYGAQQPDNVKDLADYIATDLEDAARWIILRSKPHC